MRKVDDKDVVEFVAALDECGRSAEISAGGLRFLCRQAAGMIKDLRPDLRFDPAPTSPIPNGTCGCGDTGERK
ncbi:hypothetical protein [Bradyrhizobium tunisiense]|uniref:hypothetical protein n=1 Tax=Bradyrhizobium tunisiense TaxID=3278709 RepID=UPI0035DDCD7F